MYLAPITCIVSPTSKRGIRKLLFGRNELDWFDESVVTSRSIESVK